MSFYRFSSAEKFGVWEAHGGMCFWCGEPLTYRHATIDHVLPESLEDSSARLAVIKNGFGLTEDFKINSFENWVPAHAACNSKKNDTVFAASPFMIASLEYVSRRASKARSISDRVAKNRKKGKILALLEDAATEGLVTKEEVQDLFLELPKPLPQSVAQTVELRVSSRWTVLHQNDTIVFVTDGKVGGYTTIDPNPHSSFICPFCSRPGPWNGVFCMSCNSMSDPAD